MYLCYLLKYEIMCEIVLEICEYVSRITAICFHLENFSGLMPLYSWKQEVFYSLPENFSELTLTNTKYKLGFYMKITTEVQQKTDILHLNTSQTSNLPFLMPLAKNVCMYIFKIIIFVIRKSIFFILNNFFFTDVNTFVKLNEGTWHWQRGQR